ncbi:hypothetical protein CDO11_11015 [Xanthomonas oryzae pv. oryzae]|nr:hypothetical protein B9W05_05235 [Xanthomonas oryzae pv. oryzae]AXI17576.1 hypothetical protein CDO19_11225 [Xanthomonas oryzae pv. oryzae]AXI21486.1 hypothetical protein CDO11_11015 [Xanthomonas oryzae pv. oryzae]AXX67238.1 hypothetical protein B4599_10760 [Xanthomonas oryzae pv. oryzae]
MWRICVRACACLRAVMRPPTKRNRIFTSLCRRDECLNEHLFPTLLHARTEIEQWRREYNEDRPKKAIGGMTPVAYAQQLANSDIISPGL